MNIIKLDSYENGAHDNQFGAFSIPDGWAKIPESMDIPETFPFVDIEVSDGIVTKMTAGKVPDYSQEELSYAKSFRIQQSKADLAAYLESHPILWTDGLEYSITAEKQSQLMGKLFAATIADSKHEPYDLTWNSTGEVCKSWELADLTALAFAIDARVTALVSYQQTQEVAMRNAATQEDLEAIVVDYDSVSEEVSA